MTSGPRIHPSMVGSALRPAVRCPELKVPLTGSVHGGWWRRKSFHPKTITPFIRPVRTDEGSVTRLRLVGDDDKAPWSTP